jgi:hypothetical protein
MQLPNPSRLGISDCAEAVETGMPVRPKSVHPGTGPREGSYQRQLILIPEAVPLVMPGPEQPLGGSVRRNNITPLL